MKQYSLVILFFFFAVVGKGQNKQDDLLLIAQKPLTDSSDFVYYKRSGNDSKMLQTKQRSLIAAYNPLALFFRGSMYFYQNVISPQLSSACPYEITCSNFSKQAIEKKGLFKGIFISADRLLRCNRIALLDVSPLDMTGPNGTIIDSVERY